MPCPAEYCSFRPGTELFANGHHIGHGLAGMMHGRFKVYDRHIGVFGKGPQDGIGTFVLPVLQSYEGPHANRVTITTQHAYKLNHMFSLIAVHDGPGAMLQSPAGAARLEHHSIAAK